MGMPYFLCLHFDCTFRYGVFFGYFNEKYLLFENHNDSNVNLMR